MISTKLLINTLCEFGPILGFLITFELSGDFMSGVVVMMITTIVSLIVLQYLEKHTPIFALSLIHI